jgi:Phosphotransferase enzyme family
VGAPAMESGSCPSGSPASKATSCSRHVTWTPRASGARVTTSWAITLLDLDAVSSARLASVMTAARPIARLHVRGCGYGPFVAPNDDDTEAVLRVSIKDGVVTRPASAWSPTVHSFLRYLRGQGLTCVPQPIEVEGGVERLVAIEGESGADGWAHQHFEAGLRSAARLLRTLHDASAGWDPPPDAVFCAPDVESGAEKVWCHGDFGPWNMVWQGDDAVGLIDWDFLHRGPRLDDVAYALRWFTPARDDEMALTWHHFPTVPDRAARVRVFLQTYGGLPSFDVAESIATRMEATMAMELSLAQAGVEPQRTWVAEGSQEWAAGEARWVREHAHLLRP